MPRILIDEAPAGPEMDAAIAEVLGGPRPPFGTVMTGWGLSRAWRPYNGLWCPHPFSTDIAAAWELVERLYVQWDGFFALLCDTGHWHCEGVEDFMENRVHAIADTAPLAICRAFLRAHGVEYVEVEDEDTG